MSKNRYNNNPKQIKINIDGMTCISCELLLEQELKKIKAISKVDVNSKTGSAILTYSKNKPNLEKINEIIVDTGYKISSNQTSNTKNDDQTKKQKYIELGSISILLLLLFIFLSQFEVFNGIGIKENMSFGFIFLIGVVAALSSCLAVTGGLLMSITAKNSQINETNTKLQKFKPHIYFNIGRILGYTIFGALIGAFGSLFTISTKTSGFLSLLASIIMILLGLQILNIFPKFLSKLTPKFSKNVGHKLLNLSKNQKPHTPFLLGAATFFLPCGFTQALQIYVLTLANPLTGALTMLAFALGTLPGLLSLGALSSFLKGNLKKYFFKTTGILVIFLGIFSLQSGLILAGLYTSENNQTINQNINQEIISQDKNVIIENGVQIINMKIVGYSYSPSQFTIIKDMPVKWQIDGTKARGCAQVITMPKLGITELIKPQINTITFTPTKTGNLNFMCTMAMTTPNAKFIVIENPISINDTTLQTSNTQTQPTISDNLNFRINVLYTHTIQMGDYYTETQLTKINLKTSHLSNQETLTPIQKIEELEKSYNIETYGATENKIEQLEEKMYELMEILY